MKRARRSFVRVATLVCVLSAALVWSAGPAAAAPPFTVTGPGSAAAEGDPGAPGEATFTLTYTGTQLLPGQTYEVDYYTFTEPDDAAVVGSDYAYTSGSVTFDALSTTKTVDVTLVGDDVIEDAESFSLYASGPTGSGIGRATIHDDDAATIDGAATRTAAEGDTVVLTLRYLGQELTGQNATFHVTTVDGTAVAGEDFTKPATAQTFSSPANGDTKTVSIPIVSDAAGEPAEDFTVELRSSSTATDVLASVKVTIEKSGTPPTVWVDNISDTEGNLPVNKTFTVTVKRSAATTLATKVRLDTRAAVSGPAATAGSDYVAIADRVVTIPANATEVTTTVEIVGDALDEFDETFLVEPSNPTNAELRTTPDPRGTVTIVDDDAPSSVTVVSDGAVTEPDAGATVTQRFTVALDKASGKTVTVDYETRDGNAKAPGDYVSAPGRLVFAPGQTSKKVDVTVNGDDIYEYNELYYLHIADPQVADPTAPALNATLGTPRVAEATITDNETITISVADAQANEGDGEMVFTVSLNRATDVDVEATYNTASGTETDKAVSGSDFTATGGAVVIRPGTTTAVIEVPLTDDLLEEISPERFSLTLSSPKPTGARQPTLARAVATGRIIDNDESLRIDDVSVDEGAGTAVFTVTLSAPVTEDVSFTATTSDVTAVAGRDYTTTTIEGLTILAGSTTVQFSVPILEDVIRESPETFKVTLSELAPTTIGTGVGVGFADNVGVGTILDNDPIGIAISDRVMNEGTSASNTDFTFAVTLDRTHSDTISVPWSTRFGTAKASDLSAASGTVTFTPGQTLASISVPVTADAHAEPDEQFFVDLAPPARVDASQGTGTGTIRNDDGTVPVITVANASVAEGQSGTKAMQFSVSVSPPNTQSVSFDYTTTPDPDEAVAGEDHVAKNGTITIPASPTPSGTISITINGDTVFEDDETFALALSKADNAQLASPSARGTITNDDSLPVLTIGSLAVIEGDAGTRSLALPVAFSNASENPVQVTATSADGTADAGVDYDAVSGSRTFAALATSGAIPVTVRGDTIEEDDETLTVTLSNPVGATLGTTEVGTGTITNDDVRTANERYVEWLLVHFLRRDVGPGDPLVAQYAAQLDGGASRQAVATNVAFSDEYLGAVVEFIYRQALNRAPDAGGRETWIRELRNGLTPAELAARVFASRENFANAGGTNEGWVRGLYEVLLHREADESGLRNWVAATESMGRRVVAAKFYASVESRQTRVTALYQLLLDRDPDASGLRAWTRVLQNGRDVDLAISLAKSQEYFERAQRVDARDA